MVTPASHVSLPFSICPLLLAFTHFCQAVRALAVHTQEIAEIRQTLVELSQQLRSGFERTQTILDANAQQMTRLQSGFSHTQSILDANAQQIAANTVGLVELRGF